MAEAGLPDILFGLDEGRLNALRSDFESYPNPEGMPQEDFVDCVMRHAPRRRRRESLADLFRTIDYKGDERVTWDELTSHFIDAHMRGILPPHEKPALFACSLQRLHPENMGQLMYFPEWGEGGRLVGVSKDIGPTPFQIMCPRRLIQPPHWRLPVGAAGDGVPTCCEYIAPFHAFATGSSDCRIRLYGTKDNDLCSVALLDTTPMRLRYNPWGDGRLYAGCRDGSLVGIDVHAITAEGQRTLARRCKAAGQWEVHTLPLMDFLFLPDYKEKVITASLDGAICTMDLEKARPEKADQSRRMSVRMAGSPPAGPSRHPLLTSSPSEQALRSAGSPVPEPHAPTATLKREQGILVTETRLRPESMSFRRREIGRHHNGCTSLCFNESAQVLCSVGYERAVYVWTPFSGQNREELEDNINPHRGNIVNVCEVKNTPQVLTADVTGLVKLWDLRMMRAVQSFGCGWTTQATHTPWRADDYPLSGLCYVPALSGIIVSRGRRVFTHTQMLDGTTPVPPSFKSQTGIASQAPDQGAAAHVRINATQRSFVVAAGRTVRVWGSDEGRLIAAHHDISALDISAFCLDDWGRRFYYGTQSGEVACHVFRTGALMWASGPPARISEVTGIGYWPGRRGVVAVTADGNVRVFLDDHEGRDSAHAQLTSTGEPSDLSLCAALHLVATPCGRVVLLSDPRYPWDIVQRIALPAAGESGDEGEVGTVSFLEPLGVICVTAASGRLMVYSTRPLQYTSPDGIVDKSPILLARWANAAARLARLWQLRKEIHAARLAYRQALKAALEDEERPAPPPAAPPVSAEAEAAAQRSDYANAPMHFPPVTAVSFDAGEHVLWTGDSSGRVCAWALCNVVQRHKLVPIEFPIKLNADGTSPDSSHLPGQPPCTDEDVWVLASWRAHKEEVTSMHVHPASAVVVTASGSSSVVWSITGQQLCELSPTILTTVYSSSIWASGASDGRAIAAKVHLRDTHWRARLASERQRPNRSALPPVERSKRAQSTRAASRASLRIYTRRRSSRVGGQDRKSWPQPILAHLAGCSAGSGECNKHPGPERPPSLADLERLSAAELSHACPYAHPEASAPEPPAPGGPTESVDFAALARQITDLEERFRKFATRSFKHDPDNFGDGAVNSMLSLASPVPQGEDAGSLCPGTPQNASRATGSPRHAGSTSPRHQYRTLGGQLSPAHRPAPAGPPQGAAALPPGALPSPAVVSPLGMSTLLRFPSAFPAVTPATELPRAAVPHTFACSFDRDPTYSPSKLRGLSASPRPRTRIAAGVATAAGAGAREGERRQSSPTQRAPAARDNAARIRALLFGSRRDGGRGGDDGDPDAAAEGHPPAPAAEHTPAAPDEQAPAAPLMKSPVGTQVLPSLQRNRTFGDAVTVRSSECVSSSGGSGARDAAVAAHSPSCRRRRRPQFKSQRMQQQPSQRRPRRRFHSEPARNEPVPPAAPYAPHAWRRPVPWTFAADPCDAAEDAADLAIVYCGFGGDLPGAPGPQHVARSGAPLEPRPPREASPCRHRRPPPEPERLHSPAGAPRLHTAAAACRRAGWKAGLHLERSSPMASPRGQGGGLGAHRTVWQQKSLLVCRGGAEVSLRSAN
eukprot:TRINITY_DN15602_c0_g1_i1.p1 TRINITY_DN15602_c0_g1~~TRINITY_DN15602_c0_g1_i1.p1  ORF type:complete len:1630 (+),score=423.90 TRINITY_DN15602_c0_g1_i1:87-4892(+)